MSEVSILIVDDEQAFLNSVTRKLRLEGYDNLTPLSDPLLVAPLLASKSFDVAFLDVTMPRMSGLDLLQALKSESPQTEAIMITAHEDVPTVVRAMRLGAYDYLTKPLQPDQLVHILERALERRRLSELLLLRSREGVEEALANPEAFSGIITGDERMLRLLREAELHAASDIPVLVTGETGTGKELMARAVHNASRRSDGPFVAVNMLSLSYSLFESEFFGHAKGSFTGATADKKGYLSQAAGGTLFLDEIGDLPMEIQGKLLRILQEREFVPVGKTRPERADVRFVAATNQDLEALVGAGSFRKDLFYRLRFAHIPLPPLRERQDDVRLLAVQKLKASGHSGDITERAEAMLVAHDWPGNVRELEGVLQAAANLSGGEAVSERLLNLPESVALRAARRVDADGAEVDIEPLAEVERRHILAVYKALGSNKTQAAKALGISLATLQRKLKAYRVK